MNRNAAALLEQADASVHLLDRVSAGGRFEGLSSDGPIRLATDPELLGSLAALAKLDRLVQAELTKHAGELARRSEARDETSLARKMGASGAAHLVSQVTGMPRTQAGTMVASGIAFRPNESTSGEPLPAKYAQVGAAFADGLLDPEIAAGMRRALDKAAPGLAPYEDDILSTRANQYSLTHYLGISGSSAGSSGDVRSDIGVGEMPEIFLESQLSI